MKVSIIVPVYNVEDVLHYCVDSILQQTYKDFELILVDDGSTDKSGVLCDKYAKENRNITVVHIENGGVSKARNTGIELAKGEYICFIDSDDYVAENYLDILIESKENYYDYDSIWCGFQTVSDYKGSDSKPNLASENQVVSIFSRADIMTLHEKWMSQMPWNKLFKSAIIIDNNIRFSEDLSLGEDLLFNLEYLDCSNGKIIIINKPLNFYLRSENESLDNRYYSDLSNIYERINNEIYQYLKHWNCDKKQFALYYNFCFFCYEKVLRNTFHEKSDIHDKYKYNKQIMKSEEFKLALKNLDCYINPLYRFGYKHHSYRFIRLLDKIVGLKN